MPTRRTFLKSAAATAALPLIGLPGCVPPTRPGRNEILTATEHFNELGYQTIERLPLVTGDSFNGGVRYDDTRPEAEPGKTLVRQLCCRVEDLPRGGEPGVLGLFTIFAVQAETTEYRGEVLEQALQFLENQAGLDPARLVIVTTDAFFGLEAIAARNGIDPGHVHFRSRDAATGAGDGSGYFKPAGHPYRPELWTAGLYYPLESSSDDQVIGYPLPGYLEIGEVVLAQPDSQDGESELFGLGIERLALLRGANDISFDRSVADGAMIIEKEMEKYQLPAPDALAGLRGVIF